MAFLNGAINVLVVEHAVVLAVTDAVLNVLAIVVGVMTVVQVDMLRQIWQTHVQLQVVVVSCVVLVHVVVAYLLLLKHLRLL